MESLRIVAPILYHAVFLAHNHTDMQMWAFIPCPAVLVPQICHNTYCIINLILYWGRLSIFQFPDKQGHGHGLFHMAAVWIIMISKDFQHMKISKKGKTFIMLFTQSHTDVTCKTFHFTWIMLWTASWIMQNQAIVTKKKIFTINTEYCPLQNFQRRNKKKKPSTRTTYHDKL